MHGSIIRSDPIPEKTNYCFNDTDFMFGPIYKYPNFTLFVLMILMLIKTCKGRAGTNLEGPINTWLYACVCMGYSPLSHLSV